MKSSTRYATWNAACRARSRAMSLGTGIGELLGASWPRLCHVSNAAAQCASVDCLGDVNRGDSMFSAPTK